MRAFQLTSPGEAGVHEVTRPSVGPGEVLLRVLAAGVCHSDLHLAHARALPYRLPMTLGHEVAGEIVELGAEVAGWEPGQRALVYLCWGCGSCRSCVRGAENYCRAHPAGPPGPGMGRDGGMADYVAVPARHLLDLGGLDPVAAAPLADAALTPYHAIAGASARLVPGSRTLVVGVGGLGGLAIQILAATSAAEVIAVDTDPGRLTAALGHGAHHAVAPDDVDVAVADLSGGQGADVVLDFVGSTQTLETAGRSVATGGQISVIGLAAGRLPVLAGPPPFAMPWGVSVVRPYAGTRGDLVEVLALARAGAIEVPVHRFPLADAAEALDRLGSGQVDGRAVLVP